LPNLGVSPNLGQNSMEAPVSIEQLTVKCRELAEQWKSQRMQRGYFPEAHAKLTERLDNILSRGSSRGTVGIT
jgi:hypothetical protein